MDLDNKDALAGWRRTQDETIQKFAIGAARARVARTATAHRPVPWIRVAVATIVVSVALSAASKRAVVPPLVESDYCYQLIAADRFLNGNGLTAPVPVSPGQPWDWHSDWAFLTKWPAGYSLLVGVARKAFGLTTIEACRYISAVACAAALVGWFVWVRRCAPAGAGGLALAGAAACGAVSPAFLVNPSTDALIVAALPFALMLAAEAVRRDREGDGERRAVWLDAMFVTAGLLAGSLFWIRYASLFIPLAIGLYFLCARLGAGKPGMRRIAAFAVGAAAPVVLIVAVNKLFGPGEPVQAQLNLGQSVAFEFKWSLFAKAWWEFTHLGYYDYHTVSHRFFAVWPGAVAAAALLYGPIRRRAAAWAGSPGVGLSATAVVSLIVLLVAATACFGGKFHFVALDRYYLPVRPLYFLLFLAPALSVRWRWVRASLCAILVMACLWTVQQDWGRTLQRWRAADRETASSGQWARAFAPDADEFYDWLRARESPELLVVSNFPEYIALETGIPAVPIPPDQAALDRWIDRTRQARGVDALRVVFALSTEYLGREYWVPPIDEIIDRFQLRGRSESLILSGAMIFEFGPTP